MHAQRFAEEKCFFIIRNDAISSHILCLNNFFTSGFKRKFSRKSSCFEKTIVSSYYLRDFSDIQRFSQIQDRLDLQKSSSSSSSSSSISFRTSVRFHDCRIRYELYTFKNKSSKSRILSNDERRKNNELSLRDEIERKRKIMWRACIEFNIWQS